MSVQASAWARRVRGLTVTEKLLLLLLADHAGQHEGYGDQFVCWPKQDTLAADMEVSTRTVIRALASLAERGIVTVTEQRYPDGKRRVNLYTLAVDEQHDTVSHGGVDQCDTGGQSDVTPVSQQEPSLEPQEEQAASQPAAAQQRPDILQFSLIAAVPQPATKEPPPVTSQKIIAAYVDWRKQRGVDPPARSILSRIGRAIKEALDAGVSETTIKTALTAWEKEGQTPAALPAFIDTASRGGGKPRQRRGPRKEKYVTDPRDGIAYRNPEWDESDERQEAYYTDPKTGMQYRNPKFRGA